MSRPTKCRRICNKPAFDSFLTAGASSQEQMTLTLYEYEVIRLIDLEKYTHAQCAKQMAISRSTVTEIYENARFKIADSIVNGKALLIAGGHYHLCDGSISGICNKTCRRFVRMQKIERKGDVEMRIAVTYEEGMIFQHFGHTQEFKFYDVEEGKVVESQVVNTNGQGHGALAGLLAQNNVDVLICGGIGPGAQNALSQAGIQVYGGVSGLADQAVDAYLAGSLDYNPDAHCDHHHHEDNCHGDHQGCHHS